MKSPIKVLYDEHEVIISAIEITKDAGKLISHNEIAYEMLIRDLLNFFKLYADQYHHNKEEKILFPEMNKKNEFLEDGVIKEMLDNHEDFRSMIANIEILLDKKDYLGTQQMLHIYSEALLDHIAVENDEVFQMAETLFDATELEKIYFRFADNDREVGEGKKIELLNQLKEMQKTLQ